MKTLLKKIVDLLDAGGVPVSAIETYPPNEDGAISVSLLIRKKTENYFHCTDPDCGNCPDSGTCPGSPENDDTPTEDGCHSCADDCETCPIKDGVPIMIYTPDEAIKEMFLKGATLWHEGGKRARYFRSSGTFSFVDNLGYAVSDVTNFKGFYSEAPHV